MISSEVEKLLRAAVAKVAPGVDAELALGPPKKAEFGDFATPVAMSLARALKKAPPAIAGEVKEALLAQPGAKELLAKIDVAGGYLNLTLADAFWMARLKEILEGKDAFGKSGAGEGKKVLVEYVSANPTGPLHVGHARNAAVADTIANLLAAAGWAVSREFYINDLGVQLENLGRSVWYRYAELAGKAEFPEPLPSREPEELRALTPPDRRRYERFGGLYHGEYVKDVAAQFRKKEAERWLDAPIEADVPEPTKDAIAAARDFAYPLLLEEQKKSLAQYGVKFDRFFSERSLHEGKLVEKAMDDLRTRGHLYDDDGAVWFASKRFGDDKDRVVRKSDGSWTYFAPDIAYHREKLQRGFQVLIDAWGADHHGYIPRMRAALAALGFDPKAFHVVLIQMVRLLKNGAEVKMSKRSGSFVTLQEVMDEVGPDAARFLMLTRSSDSPLDFDLDLAKKQSNDNPVFYVQYGHARVCSVFAMAKERGVAPGVPDLSRLASPMEKEMIRRLARFPDEVADAAAKREPHRIAGYLRELVGAFHAYYSKKDASGAPEHKIVSDDTALTRARLALADAVRIVLRNGLALCGVSAPEKMSPPESDKDA